MLRNNGANSFTMFLWIAAGAVVSPTSVLRMLTGVTLIAGHAHVRSIELSIATTMVQTTLWMSMDDAWCERLLIHCTLLRHTCSS
jgi:hypothetical protein